MIRNLILTLDRSTVDALPLDDSQSERSSASSSPRSGESIYKGILEETCLTEFFLEVRYLLFVGHKSVCLFQSSVITWS